MTKDSSLSASVELSAEIRDKQREEWLTKNHAALEAYNAHVAKDGVFSDGLRSF